MRTRRARVVVYHPVDDDLPGATTHPFGTNAAILRDRGKFMEYPSKRLKPGAASRQPSEPM